MVGDPRRGDFWFIGNNLALDLVNTEMIHEGALTDRLATPGALSQWMVAAGLSDRPVRVPDAVFAEAIALRGALRAAFDGVAAGQPVAPAAVDHLNRVLQAEPSSQISAAPHGFERRRMNDVAARPELIVWLVADAAAELLSGPLLRRVRKCASQACVLYFADTSRRGSRRWCSMQVCGNREKAAAHYDRRRRSRA